MGVARVELPALDEQVGQGLADVRPWTARGYVTIRSPGAFKNFYASPAARWFELLHVGTLEPAVMRRFASPKREF